MPRWLALGAAALLAAGCDMAPASPPAGGSTPAASASSSVTPAGAFSAQMRDSVTETTCPPGSPEQSRCFLLTATGVSPQLGALTSDPYLDVEVPQTSPLCGADTTFAETLRASSGQGTVPATGPSITAAITGPRICLFRDGPLQRTYQIVSGSGRWSAARGSGAMALTVLSGGASEQWQGTLVAANE